MTIGIMQPYIFPYIGYFKLINAVDTFVFYDNVNFIKGGWINRNIVLMNGNPNMFTFSVEKISSFSLISETKVHATNFKKEKKKFLVTIKQQYSKAPFFEDVFPLIDNVLNGFGQGTIAELAIMSIAEVSRYLELHKLFRVSSKMKHDINGENKMDKIISIMRREKSNVYINPIGGQKLYSKEDFEKKGVKLNFIKSKEVIYKQFNNEFVPNLSIIDVLMFNSKEQVLEMLNDYEIF